MVDAQRGTQLAASAYQRENAPHRARSARVRATHRLWRVIKPAKLGGAQVGGLQTVRRVQCAMDHAECTRSPGCRGVEIRKCARHGCNSWDRIGRVCHVGMFLYNPREGY